MAFTGNFMCTSFKQQLLEAQHNFLLSGGDTFKIALYTNSASFTAATTDYTATNEVAASGSYSAGGGTLTRIDPATSGTTAFTDFADITFTSATLQQVLDQELQTQLLYWILGQTRPRLRVTLRLFSQRLTRVTLSFA